MIQPINSPQETKNYTAGERSITYDLQTNKNRMTADKTSERTAMLNRRTKKNRTIQTKRTSQDEERYGTNETNPKRNFLTRLLFRCHDARDVSSGTLHTDFANKRKDPDSVTSLRSSPSHNLDRYFLKNIHNIAYIYI